MSSGGVGGVDHTDTSHDAGWAYAIGLIGMFLVLATLSVPFFLDETWYAPWRVNRQGYVVARGVPVVSPGGAVIQTVDPTGASCKTTDRPDLSGLRGAV